MTEVAVEICPEEASGRSGKETHSHWIFATLTPEGTRAHKIDGKNKTSKEVKASLYAICNMVDVV